MKVKVCGLRYLENIKEIAQCNIDLLGLIFYPDSPRNVNLSEKEIQEISAVAIPKVGVFVNEDFYTILQIAYYYKLTYVQLHGNESPQFVKELSAYFKVIKAFSVDDKFDFEVCKSYDDCDYFLFDTKGAYPGGNGQRFDWNKLNEYKGETPFLLSGGIAPDSISALKSFTHPNFSGIDINSGFEEKPGMKKAKAVRDFFREVKNPVYSALSSDGYYGQFGGAFIPELLHNNIVKLKAEFNAIKTDSQFKNTYFKTTKRLCGKTNTTLLCPKPIRKI